MRLVVLAGLPGSGKSSLARALSRRLDCPVFDKDRVREALFGPDRVRYTREQDDACVEALLAAAQACLRSGQEANAILDGRTFTGEGQVERMLEFERTSEIPLRWIQLDCRLSTAAARLRADAGLHPAADRDPNRLMQLAARARRLDVPHLALSSEPLGDEPPAAAIERLADAAMAWLDHFRA